MATETADMILAGRALARAIEMARQRHAEVETTPDAPEGGED